MEGDASAWDVAIGSRYVPGGEVIGWPWRRRVMSRCLNAFARRALGLTCHDCSGSFRCYRVSKLEQIELEKVRSRGYSLFEEILWHLRRADARFIEIPITFQDRERGQSKINLREAWTAIRIIATLGLQGRR
jgi:dolichol-phosphate mannosyltransferase